jgi:hypothetical protein
LTDEAKRFGSSRHFLILVKIGDFGLSLKKLLTYFIKELPVMIRQFLQLLRRCIGMEAQPFQTALGTIVIIAFGAAIVTLAFATLYSGGSLKLHTVFFHLEVHGH